MDNIVDEEIFSQLEEHLKCNELNWLMEAGISYDAKLPLMVPLTNKVKKYLEDKDKLIYDEILSPLFDELPESCHIEHVLSHLGDYAALSERSRDKKVIINGSSIDLNTLENAHNLIIESISNAIRSGYVEDKYGNTKFKN